MVISDIYFDVAGLLSKVSLTRVVMGKVSKRVKYVADRLMIPK